MAAVVNELTMAWVTTGANAENYFGGMVADEDGVPAGPPSLEVGRCATLLKRP